MPIFNMVGGGVPRWSVRPEPFTLVATYLKSTQRLRKLHIIRLFALTKVTITGSISRFQMEKHGITIVTVQTIAMNTSKVQALKMACLL